MQRDVIMLGLLDETHSHSINSKAGQPGRPELCARFYAIFSAASCVHPVCMTCTCMAGKHFGTEARVLVPEQTVMNHLAVFMSVIAEYAGFRIPAHFAFASASICALSSLQCIQ